MNIPRDGSLSCLILTPLLSAGKWKEDNKGGDGGGREAACLHVQRDSKFDMMCAAPINTVSLHPPSSIIPILTLVVEDGVHERFPSAGTDTTPREDSD